MTTPKILAFAGSLRTDSFNKKLVRIGAEGARAAGAEVTLIDLRDFPLPVYDGDLEAAGMPETVLQLKKLFLDHQGLLIASPEYNGSIPGTLKNALDWVSRPFDRNPLQRKPVAVIGASTGGFGAVWAQAELRKVLSTLGGRVLDIELPVPHAHTRFEDGGLTDEEIQLRLEETIEALAEGAQMRRGEKAAA